MEVLKLKYYTVNEVAVVLRKSKWTIWRWIQEGRLKAKKVKDGYLIPEDVLKEILADIDKIPQE